MINSPIELRNFLVNLPPDWTRLKFKSTFNTIVEEKVAETNAKIIEHYFVIIEIICLEDNFKIKVYSKTNQRNSSETVFSYSSFDFYGFQKQFDNFKLKLKTEIMSLLCNNYVMISSEEEKKFLIEFLNLTEEESKHLWKQ